MLLQVEGDKADPQLLRDVCMHITAKNPVAAGARTTCRPTHRQGEGDRPAIRLATDPKNKSKPANIVEKIAEGKMKTWFAENVLVEQPFVKDDSKTVGELLKAAGLKLVKFVRYQVGEVS